MIIRFRVLPRFQNLENPKPKDMGFGGFAGFETFQKTVYKKSAPYQKVQGGQNRAVCTTSDPPPMIVKLRVHERGLRNKFQCCPSG